MSQNYAYFVATLQQAKQEVKDARTALEVAEARCKKARRRVDSCGDPRVRVKLSGSRLHAWLSYCSSRGLIVSVSRNGQKFSGEESTCVPDSVDSDFFEFELTWVRDSPRWGHMSTASSTKSFKLSSVELERGVRALLSSEVG